MMPCYHPLEAWRSRQLLPSGKRGITFKKQEAFSDLPLQLPCGQCIGCKLERSRQWALRCQHEASLYEKNCFLTLTYDRENLPKDLSLNLKHFQLFMKKLRKKYVPKNPYSKKYQPEARETFTKKHSIRFFHCGEYGDDENRPHYHAIIFNHDWDDLVLAKITPSGKSLYSSDTLTKLWGMGRCRSGSVTFESAAYVARYCLKKITGPDAKDHYHRVNKYGETWPVIPEYATMSRRPGLGKGWYDKFEPDCYPSDYAIINGSRVQIPKFYDKNLEQTNPQLLKQVKIKRLQTQNKPKAKSNRTKDRLLVRETVKKSQISTLKRTL